MLKIEYSNQSKKFLEKLDKIIIKRILNKIEKLSEEPFPSDSVRITNRKEKVFRVRVGYYRIIYEIFHKENALVISKINKRSRIYK